MTLLAGHQPIRRLRMEVGLEDLDVGDVELWDSGKP